MRLYASRERFAEALGSIGKWQLTLEALASPVPTGPMYSISELVTYRRAQLAQLAGGEFVGRRRYQLVVAGPCRIEIAPKDTLTPRQAYSDLTDRETFTGAGEPLCVPAGGILIVDIGEAARFPAGQVGECTIAHVSVAGTCPPGEEGV